ncbi:hypothetical protein M432DRAFT_238226 [Thermoascus aurantiacus ATCC 26904]
MTENTFHRVKEDIRKPESRLSGFHRGKTPADSDVSALKSIIDKNTDKGKEIDERKANLPLPDQPPVPSDWQSRNKNPVDGGSGRVEGPVSGENNSALRWPATAASSARVDGDEWFKETQPGPEVGRQGHDNLDTLPRDARER